MAVKLTNAAASAAADAVVDLLDLGPAAAVLEIRTGSQPATADTADSGTLLATLTFTDPAFGSAANGVATAAPITQDSSADATGTAGYFVLKTSTGTKVLTGTVGTSGADLNLVTTSIVVAQPVQVSSFTYTQPLS